MSTILVTLAREQDAEALSALAARLFIETYASSTPVEQLTSYVRDHFSAHHQRAEILDANGAIFIAQGDASTPVGFAHVQDDGDAMLLNRIYIERSSQGTGLAQRLLSRVEEECRRRLVFTLRLTVFDQNARAIAFYRRQGFVTTGTTSFLVGDEVQSDIVMEKQLGTEPAGEQSRT